MSNEDKKAKFERMLGGYDGYNKIVNAVEDSMMKAHEFVGHFEDVVSNACDAVRDGMMTLSELLDEHREQMWAVIQKFEDEAYPANTMDSSDVKTGVFNDVKPLKPTADMSRAEKVAFIIDGYLLPDTPEQKQVFAASSDESLSEAVNVIRFRNNLK